MSNTSPHPLCIRQRVFPVWRDPSLSPDDCTLAHLASTTHNTVDFKFQVDCDGEQRAAMRFALTLDLKVGTRSVKRPCVYHIALADLARTAPLQYRVLEESEFGHSSVASAVRDAGFVVAGRVLHATLQLRRPGRVLSRGTTLRPSTETARALLLQFKSVSQAYCFSFYMKPDEELQAQLDVLCAGLRADTIKQQPLALDHMQEVDWSKLPASDDVLVSCSPTIPPPPYEEGQQAYVPSGSCSVISETEAHSTPSPPPTKAIPNKRRRLSLEQPNPVLAAGDVKLRMAADIRTLIFSVLSTIPPGQFTHPRLQPYLNELHAAVQRADSMYFDRAYARLAAILLFDFVHHNPDPCQQHQEASNRDDDEDNETGGEKQRREDREATSVSGSFDQAEPQRSASSLEKAYLNDIFALVSWLRSRDGFSVPMLWDNLCALGRAARRAAENGITLEDAAPEEYGRITADILTLGVVRLGCNIKYD